MEPVVGNWLEGCILGLVYPLVILGTCLGTFATAAYITIRARTPRAVVALGLPIALLPFVLYAQRVYNDPIAQSIDQLYESARFVIGAAIAVLLVELGRYLLKRESEVGPALFVLFLSTVGAFILFSITSRSLNRVQFIFFGFVAGGGLYLILRGVPVPPALLKDWPWGSEWRRRSIAPRQPVQRSQSPSTSTSNRTTPPRSDSAPPDNTGAGGAT